LIHITCSEKSRLEVKIAEKCRLFHVACFECVRNGNSDLGNSDLGNSDLGNSDLGNSDLGNSDLGNSDLGNSDLDHVCLNGNSDFDKLEKYTRAPQRGKPDLGNSDLDHVCLNGNSDFNKHEKIYAFKVTSKLYIYDATHHGQLRHCNFYGCHEEATTTLF
jgi:uncharacterized protein YjbI with pentapeptide repeats